MQHRFMPDRNRAIARSVLDGQPVCAVAMDYNLTPQRIGQIVAWFADRNGMNEPFTQSVTVLRDRWQRQEKFSTQVPA